MTQPKNHEDAELRGEWWVLDRLLAGEKPSAAPGPGEADDEKLRTKRHYDALNRALNELKYGKYAFFLNFGYVPDDNPSSSRISPPPGHFDVSSRRLVLELIGDCPVDDRDVLDVSCGRGSVPRVLLDYFHPRSYVGIDLSDEAVRFCRARHPASGYAFQVGDAESLPLRSASFDVVMNVEASHNYPRIASFFGEIRRVLRPGGWFLYTDVMAPGAFDRNVEQLIDLGLEMTRNVDITSNVLLSCEQSAPRRLKAYRDPEQRAFMADFLCAPGSNMFRALSQGRLRYRLFSFRRRLGTMTEPGAGNR